MFPLSWNFCPQKTKKENRLSYGFSTLTTRNHHWLFFKMERLCSECVDFMQLKEALKMIIAEEMEAEVSVCSMFRPESTYEIAESTGYMMTPLIHASFVGHLNCVEALIAAGADVNENDVTGVTPLIKASRRGQTNRVDILVASGADVNNSDMEGETPAMAATKSQRIECLNALIAAGANVNQSDRQGNTPLITASIKINNQCLNVLIAAGVDVNAKYHEGESALHHAIKEGNISAVNALISTGADVNQRDQKGWTLLKISFTLQSECGNALIAGGADVNSVNEDGETALHIVVSRKMFSFFCFLMKTGPDVNIVDAEGNTALSSIGGIGATPYAHELLLSGAKVNITTPNALHRYIVRSQRVPAEHICMLLIAAGENVDAPSIKIKSNASVQVPVPYGFTSKEKRLRDLKQLCREAIRKRLLLTSKVRLFIRVPLLGLPSLITEYLLYNVECEPMIKRKMSTVTTK